MSYLFYSCSSLKELPDISKWNISNLEKKSEIFSECKSDLQIPPKFLN